MSRRRSDSHGASAIKPRKIVARRDTGAFEQIDEILHRNVARRFRREGATADAAGAGVEPRDAALVRRPRIREARVARVVEVAAQRNVTNGRAHGVDRALYLSGRGSADGVGERNLARARLGKRGCDFDDAVERYFALERATERD